MSESTTRTIEFRLASPKDLTRRCEDANKALLKVQWSLEDLYQQQDADQIVVDADEVADWKRTLRDANAALALAAAALRQFDTAMQEPPQERRCRICGFVRSQHSTMDMCPRLVMPGADIDPSGARSTWWTDA